MTRLAKLGYLTILLLSLLILSCKDNSSDEYNFGFEQVDTNKDMAAGWYRGSDYPIAISRESHSGRYAGKMASHKKGLEGRILYTLPANFEGQEIKLEGYIRTKDVKEGFAGLLIKVEGKKTLVVNGRKMEESGFNLGFENMQEQAINGTNDWKKYTISIPYPEGAEQIFIGGILSGKGEAWFDDFVVSIDGKDLRTLTKNDNTVRRANLDMEFDMGSDIELPEISDQLVINLELLGKVWGFLKYHHPLIAKGNYNWDYELFRILPKYLAVKDREQRDRAILEWIDGYGKLEKCESCIPPSPESFLKPDIEWIKNGDISKELKQRLMGIFMNRNQGENFYVRMSENIGNPQFTNENPYPLMPFPDKGFRLLAVYKYWNIIHYFFPYRHLTDKNWNNVLKEYIPVFINAENELQYELAVLQLVGEVNDTHANIWVGANKISDLRGMYFPPFKTRFVENKLVVTEIFNSELLNASGPAVGDIITHVNGRAVEHMTDSVAPYYPASNKAAQMRDIANDMLRSKRSLITIDYISNNENREAKIILYEKPDLNFTEDYRNDGRKSFELLDQNIGYITLRSLKREEIDRAMQLFKNTRGLVIDIRNRPNTFVPFTLGPYFVESSTPFVKFTNGNVHNPGEFVFTDALEIPPSSQKYSGKLILLVNELSQSQSEYTAMALRAGNNVTVIGNTTAGADGSVSGIQLPGGLSTQISGVGIYYPDGTQTQRIGIVPDIEVKPTIKGIQNGRDELLDRAIEIINR